MIKGYCQDCLIGRREYDSAFIMIRPSVGDCIRTEEQGETKRFLSLWEEFKEQQRIIWLRYQEIKLACEDSKCKNFRK